MKICVYAISKNEAKFVKRWVNSMQEADEIYVLDTGSTDNTVELLQELHVNVKQEIITPWRFDIARNKSLAMVPLDTDVCLCTDLDEVLKPGWRKEIEKYWQKDTTRAKYNYNWRLDSNNKPLINFYIEKMHSRQNYHWTHPVHEVLTYEKEKENTIIIDSITVNHYPDDTKSRSSYLPLLELSVKENPTDDRNVHYLGREYMYYQKWEQSIQTLKKHLTLKNATWKDERAASMRFISRCYKKLGHYHAAKIWLTKAYKEAPYLRDALVERALLEYELQNYKNTEKYCLQALTITTHTKSYINEPFSWDHTIYDLLAISCYNLKKYAYALYFNNIALSISPKNERLLKNNQFYQAKIYPTKG